jgi:hypothetical protein
MLVAFAATEFPTPIDGVDNLLRFSIILPQTLANSQRSLWVLATLVCQAETHSPLATGRLGGFRPRDPKSPANGSL